jgi:hypothetical protein
MNVLWHRFAIDADQTNLWNCGGRFRGTIMRCCWLLVTCSAFPVVLSGAIRAGDEKVKVVSEEELLSVLKTKGEFKQHGGSYVIRAKRVDGRSLSEVEIQFVTDSGRRVKLTAKTALLKINEEKEVDVTFEKAEVESGGETATVYNRMYTFARPIRGVESK